MKIEKIAVVLGTLLFVSLAANFFMAGLMLGRSWQGGPPPSFQHRDEDLRGRLSEADRGVLKKTMERNHAQFAALRHDLEAAREKVKEAMKADDEAELASALKAEKEKKEELLRLMQKSRAEAMEQLSPQGRETLQRMGFASRHRSSSYMSGDFIPDIGGPDDFDLN